MQRIIIDNECLTNQEYYLDFLENEKLWCEYLKQRAIKENETELEIYFTNDRFKLPVENAIEKFLDDNMKITFIHSYSEDSKIITKRKWKTKNFGYIDEEDLVPLYGTTIPIPYFDFLNQLEKEGSKCILANIIVIK